MNQKHLKIIKKIFKTSDQENLLVFIKGGWNIDLAYGEQTRIHDDIDFHYDLRDKNKWQEFFRREGFDQEAVDDYYSVYRKDGIVIDFEGFKLDGESIIWSHGGSSKSEEVFEESVYEDIDYKRMKLDLELYLKEKSIAANKSNRSKDEHDIQLLKKILKSTV